MRFTAFLVFLLFIIFALFARWYYVCEIKGLCEDVPVIEPREQTLTLTEGDSIIILDGYDQFVFDSASVSPDLNANNLEFLDAVAAFFKKDTTRNLSITGFYRISEDSIPGTFLENIGLERANTIRKLLIDRGLDESRISLDHGISDSEDLKEPLLFTAYISDIPDAFEKVQFSFTNMTISDANFEFNSDVFKPGTPFKLYADSVKTFMELNPNKKLTIIGHTDNKGKTWYNNKLGLRRAENAKKYFESLGLNMDINTASAGEKKPVASNNTEEGRQRNRRVNFVIE